MVLSPLTVNMRRTNRLPAKFDERLVLSPLTVNMRRTCHFPRGRPGQGLVTAHGEYAANTVSWLTSFNQLSCHRSR